jgi:tetratricopeptide (TPR) repeat protein
MERAIGTWWSLLTYRSFQRYQGEEIQRPWIRRGVELKWLTDEMVPAAADALFWIHATKGDKSPFKTATPSTEVRRDQVIDYPALVLLHELFTLESNASIQNHLAWKLATWPDETLRDAVLARELAQAAVTCSPSDGGYRNTLGVAEYRCGNYAEALKDLTESNRLNDERQPADHYFLAMAHAQLGHGVESLRHLDLAERLTEVQQRLTASEALAAQPAVADSDELRRFQEEARSVLAEKLPPKSAETREDS